MRTLIISAMATSPVMLLYPVLGWPAVAILILNTLILSCIARYISNRKRDNSDGWDGY